MSKDKQQGQENDILEMALLNQPDQSAHGKVVAKEVFSDERMDQKTRLGVNEINLTNRGYFFSQYFKKKSMPKSSVIMDLYYKGIVSLRPSLDGLSREEFVNIFREEVRQLVNEGQQAVKK